MSCTKKRLNLSSITTILKAFVSPWMFLFADGSHFLASILTAYLLNYSYSNPLSLSLEKHFICIPFHPFLLFTTWWITTSLMARFKCKKAGWFTWRSWLFFPLLALAPLWVLSLLGGVAWVLLFYLHLHLCRGVQNIRNPSVGAEVSRVVELGVGLWGLNPPAHYDRRSRRHGSRAGWSCAGSITQFISGGFLLSLGISVGKCVLKPGLEIGHFEKTQGEKTQNSWKNSITQGKKLKVSANFCWVVVQNHVFCY